MKPVRTSLGTERRGVRVTQSVVWREAGAETYDVETTGPASGVGGEHKGGILAGGHVSSLSRWLNRATSY